jgi:hypothetical protein
VTSDAGGTVPAAGPNRGDGAIGGSHEGDSVTLLITFGPLAAKQVRWDPLLAKPVITAYGNAKNFEISEYPVGNLDELAQLLTAIECCPRAMIVRGRPAGGIDRKQAFRRLHPRTRGDGTVEPATLAPAARHWIPLDFDSAPCPDSHDPVHEPGWAVEHAVSHLPKEFHGASCWWAFTAGQGFKPGLRMRLFFWADRPLTDTELKQWLGERNPVEGQPRAKWPQRYPVDLAIFAAAQPIYVARPIFVGVPDPVPIRSGLWRGDRDAITPPAFEKPKPKATYPRQPRETDRPVLPGGDFTVPTGSGFEYYRGRIGDHESGDGFHGPVKSAVAAWIGRHGAQADTTWLRADLEHAIRSAPRDPAKHDDGYIELRVADLDTLIPAIVALQVASEAAWPEARECEPTYPAPLGTVEEARELLARVFDDHVTSIAIYAEATAVYQEALKEWRGRQAA